MNKERLGTGVIAVVVGLLVAFVAIPSSERMPIPAGDYVLVEGEIDGFQVEPGLELVSDGQNAFGSGPCNRFDRRSDGRGFMTIAGCIPELPWSEFKMMQTVNENPVIEGDRLVFESAHGRLVYERQ